MFCYMSWLRFLPRHWKPTNFYFWSSGRSKVLVGLLASRFNMKTLEDWENCLERASSVYECLSKVVCSLTPRIHDETFELRGCTWCLLHQSLMCIDSDGVYQDLLVSTVMSSTPKCNWGTHAGGHILKCDAYRFQMPSWHPLRFASGFQDWHQWPPKLSWNFLGFTSWLFIVCSHRSPFSQ